MRTLRIVRAAGILLTLAAVAAAQFVEQIPPANTPGSSPAAVVVGQFNAGTIPDMAVAKKVSGTGWIRSQLHRRKIF